MGRKRICHEPVSLYGVRLSAYGVGPNRDLTAGTYRSSSRSFPPRRANLASSQNATDSKAEAYAQGAHSDENPRRTSSTTDPDVEDPSGSSDVERIVNVDDIVTTVKSPLDDATFSLTTVTDADTIVEIDTPRSVKSNITTAPDTVTPPIGPQSYTDLKATTNVVQYATSKESITALEETTEKASLRADPTTEKTTQRVIRSTEGDIEGHTSPTEMSDTLFVHDTPTEKGLTKAGDRHPDEDLPYSVQLKSSIVDASSPLASTLSTETMGALEVPTVEYTVPYGEKSGYNFVISPTIEETTMTAAFRDEDDLLPSPDKPERRQDHSPSRISPSQTVKAKSPDRTRNPTIELLTGLIQLLGGDVRRRATPPPQQPQPPVLSPASFNFHPPQAPLVGPPPPPQFLPPPHPHHARPQPYDLAQQFPGKPNIPTYIPHLNFPPGGHHLMGHHQATPHTPPSFYYPSPSDVSNILGVSNEIHSERPHHHFELKTSDITPTVTVPADLDEETTQPPLRSSSRNTIVFIQDAPPSLLPSNTIVDSSVISASSLSATPVRNGHTDATEHEKGTFVIEVLEPVATPRPSKAEVRPSNAWLPVGAEDTSRMNIHYDPHNEPDIITHGPEPSIFDITVVGDLNPTVSHGSDMGPPAEIITTESSASEPKIQPTPTTGFVAPESILPTTLSSPANTSPSLTVASTTSTIVYSEASSSSTPTPSIVVSSTTTTKDDVVYGKSTGEVSVAPTGASTTSTSQASSTKGHGIGKPYVVPVDVDPVRPSVHQGGFGHVKTSPRHGSGPIRQQKPKRQPTFKSKSNATLVRIDTCIVGDDSTCDATLNEWCRTDQGISTCTCRPGYARTQPRGPCLATISMQLTFKLDRMGDKKLHYNTNYLNPDSEEYQVLEFETRQALRSLFSKSSFARVFMDSRVNRFKGSGSKVLVNATVEFEENDITRVASVKRVVQHEIVNLISRGKSNLGDSRLLVEPLLNSALTVEDVNECRDKELHDCSPNANCENTFGAFKCVCKPGYTDKNPATRRTGRTCTGCGPDYCNNRGECSIVNGERSCSCKGKFIGPRCDVDGEVLAVALGASVTAVIIIILTLVCLCLWNRRWKREQAKAEVMSVASMAGYLNKTGSVGYRMASGSASIHQSQDERFRWSAHLDNLPNIYVQPDSSPLHSMPRAQSIYATQRHMRAHSPGVELENPYGPLPGIPQRPKSRSAMTHFGPASLASPYEFDPNKQPSLFGSYRTPGTTRSMRPVFNAHW
ncbi:mucin-2-like isoform X2 [Varroa jacobsoni]|uniref:mucin-2-like isoform X2 n=1 Tax=Varroa jacobsoni TaxID=62625 RepID=UPI000BF489A1|nr:mucin-2-like isoform X2 [Varroa jacobsoni]